MQSSSSPEAGETYARHVSTLHAADHLQRLIEASRERGRRVWNVAHVFWRRPRNCGGRWTLRTPGPAAALKAVARRCLVSATLAATRDAHRRELLEMTARGEVSPAGASRMLEHMRLIDRLAYHLWRAVHHLGDEAASARAAEVSEEPPEIEDARSG